MCNGGYTRANIVGLKLDYPLFLRELVSTLAKESGGWILLVPQPTRPFTMWRATTQPASRCATPCRRKRSTASIGRRQYDQQEIKGVIGQCGFFVGSRMHLLHRKRSPRASLCRSRLQREIPGWFESVGAEDEFVDGREVSTTQAVERIAALFQERQKIREPLRSRAGGAVRPRRRIQGSA